MLFSTYHLEIDDEQADILMNGDSSTFLSRLPCFSVAFCYDYVLLKSLRVLYNNSHLSLENLF